MDYAQVVTDAARKLNLLTPEGKLTQLSSMNLISLVSELEDATSLRIRISDIDIAAFRSIESFAELLESTANKS